MKKHNILKVILLVILFVTVCTWIFPSLSYNSGLVEGDRLPLGIFDICEYLVEVGRYFPNIMIMTLVTGMFYGVCFKIPAYRALLDKIVKLFKGKENIFLVLSMVLISAIVSVTGLSFGMIFVFPFIISIVMLMGYNKLVAASVTVGSVVVGLIGTTLGSNTVYYVNVILSTSIKGEMITKVILLVIGLVVLSYNVIQYASKTKNGTDKVVELVPSEVNAKKDVKAIEVKVKEENKKEDKKETKKVSKPKATKKKTSSKTKKEKTKAYDLKSKLSIKAKVKEKRNKKVVVWPFVLIFDLAVIIMAVSTFDWARVLDMSWPKDILVKIQEFKIFGVDIFAKLLGNVQYFGSWNLSYEIPTTIFVFTCLLALIYRVKFNNFIDGLELGVKKAIKPAIYMFITYTVLIMVTYNPFQLHFTKFLLNITGSFNVITMTAIVMISSVFNLECLYVAQSTLPYITTVITDTTLYPLLAVLYQAIYGLMMLVAPTSIILLGTLTYLDVSYGQWLKHIWKLFVELLVILVVIFLVLFLI